MITPSFIAMGISGILIFLTVIKYMNYSGKIEGMQEINLLLFFASSIAFHGLLHMGAEVFYGFNPLEGKFTFKKIQ
jgi:predicted membrane channel-forming protein YqfA (hemolysin III family)